VVEDFCAVEGLGEAVDGRRPDICRLLDLR
jgi:hypothetical protein